MAAALGVILAQLTISFGGTTLPSQKSPLSRPKVHGPDNAAGVPDQAQEILTGSPARQGWRILEA
ncbi:hypothetical protein [Kribbella sp. NPDC055071]